MMAKSSASMVNSTVFRRRDKTGKFANDWRNVADDCVPYAVIGRYERTASYEP